MCIWSLDDMWQKKTTEHREEMMWTWLRGINTIVCSDTWLDRGNKMWWVWVTPPVPYGCKPIMRPQCPLVPDPCRKVKWSDMAVRTQARKQKQEYDLAKDSQTMPPGTVEVWLCGLTYYTFYYRMSHADESCSLLLSHISFALHYVSIIISD